MCGIAGIWGDVDEGLVRDMMERLRHRGPDADGVFAGRSGVLGHRRLSIMDPTGGDQPIFSEDRRRVIVGNGEIYNFPHLRDDLGRGHRFATRSDTESAVHLYEDLAQAAAERLDGMFAFAIADGDALYAARDVVGIKPLYLGRTPKGTVLSSELKAFDQRVSDVQEFPPGSWYHSKLGFHRFADLPRHTAEDLPVAEHARRVRATLERAVGKRLMSDVPVGAFLSGGLDSSLIAAIARRHVDELHTFSVGTEGSRDLEAARLVSRHLDTVHHEYIITPEEVAERLPEIVYWLESYDQDLVRSAIPCYFTSRLAADHVKVILTGEGADELFAGYTYYKDVDGDRLHDELHRSVSALHNINLQRVDRLTMAHSIEGRVPFLDLEMIALAQKVPHALKLHRPSPADRPVEKWILRHACEDLLPAEIVWRDKEQFDEGSGTVDLLAGGLDRFMPTDGAGAYQRAHPEAQLRSAEECAYHKLLVEAYSHPESVLANVTRWADRPC